jgi:cytochrome c peroxidase
VELGRDLFIAKGCITCHYNSRAGSSSEYWTIDMGAPDLSKFSANPEIIFMRLKDPSSVKSDTKMPNLDLKKAEIEAGRFHQFKEPGTSLTGSHGTWLPFFVK